MSAFVPKLCAHSVASSHATFGGTPSNSGRARYGTACLDCIAAVGRPPSVCCLTANRHDRRDGLRCLGIRLRVDLRPYLLPPVRWFRHVRILLPCPYAARCPAPVASTSAELIPELSSPGMLMTDGCHWRHRCDRNHTLPSTVGSCSSGPLLRSWPISALQLARRGGRRATADLSKRTIIAGCGPACLEALTSAIADGPGRGRPEQRL